MAVRKLMNHFTYKGKQVRVQRVRVKKGPKIEEILDNDRRVNLLENETKVKNISNEVNQKGQIPDWNFYIFRK